MNKMDRQKFDNLKSGDPAPLVGQQGDRAVPLARVLSRRRGNDTKEWSTT